MKVKSIFLLGAILGIFSSIVLWADKESPLSNTMSDAATEFLQSLPPELLKKAQFEFDSPQRTRWFFTPQQVKKQATRKGLRMEELDEKQKKLVLNLLRCGTSKKGYEQATTIMSLESILKGLEKNGAMTRNPNWYFVSIFGKPSRTGTWGWRVEGHHLSVNFTIDRGQLSSVTPFFFGANPAEVKSGDRKGLRTLPEIEDLARKLINSLSSEEKKLAEVPLNQLAEVNEGTDRSDRKDPIGMSSNQFDEKQQVLLAQLIKAYTSRMPDEIGTLEFQLFQKSAKDKVFFSFAGSTTPGKAYKYRIHGPTFLVEFLNDQTDGSGNPANHIHSVWRHLPADFGIKN